MPDDGTKLDWPFDPVGALARLTAPALLLHSGRFDARWATRSILSTPAAWFRFAETPSGGRSQWRLPDDAAAGGDAPPVNFTHRPLTDLRTLMARLDGLWIGYIAYDIGRWIEKLPGRAARDRDWPVIELAWCPGWATYDLATRQWTAHGRWTPCPPQMSSQPVRAATFTAGDVSSVFTREQYEQAVRRVIEYIGAGDVFQVNLAQRLSAMVRSAANTTGPGSTGRALFEKLSAVSPAWYGAYLELPGGRAIASTSPELFLEVSPGGHVITRPIKGTRPAAASADELLNSEKDAAELYMIVDLLRNDLGRVCDYGSVRVTQPRTIESHPTIHHGVATIEGRLHASKDLVSLLRAALPGGSITGAPKVRAMQIIDELEPVRRGPYCGAIGWLSGDRGACLNVAIRTMMLEQAGPGQTRVDLPVGGGIVADSDPAAEHQETLDKAAAMLRALGTGLTAP